MKKIDKRAPYHGLTFKQFFAKRHSDLTIIKANDGTKVIAGEFCGFADGPMTDTGCVNVCPEYSSCDAAMEIGDLVKIMDGEGGTWCSVCGDTIPESSEEDIIRVNNHGRRYKCCIGTCAEKVMKPK